MPKLKQQIREKSPIEGEFIFEQWAKYLTLHLVEDDILHDFGPVSEQVKNVTLEKLRCVFAQGYRFAMFQVLQSSQRIYDYSAYDLISQDEAAPLIGLLEEQQNFINEKVEDSFMLNRTDGRDGKTLSKQLKSNLEGGSQHDFLNWG